MGNPVVFEIGQTSRLTRTVTAAVVDAFAQVSTDDNPLHLDEAYAATTRFGKRVAHGMIAASFISAMMGTQFPGPGAIYMSQSLTFLRPVFLGDVLDVSVTVTGYRADKQIVSLSTIVTNQNGKPVVTGEAVCLVSDLVAAPTSLLDESTTYV